MSLNICVVKVMWFSSGGTKSVVHTDSVDNINCLYRGEKTLFMVDPAVHGKNVSHHFWKSTCHMKIGYR